MDEVLLVFAAITIGFFLLFMLVYRRNKASILSGFIFGCFVLSAGLSYVMLALNTNNPVLLASLVIVGFALIFVLAFGVFALIALLLLNARTMFRRERRSLANSLTLIMALGIVLLMVVTFLLRKIPTPDWLWYLWGGVLGLVALYVLHIVLFLTTLLLCNLARPPLKQDYIIVLGSGLVEGEVPPLLGSRINKAMQFYYKQKDKGRHAPPKIIFSGGQGADEPRSEAAAMREYALMHGIPEEDILLEDAAVNTQQNMVLSKKIMEEHSGGKAYRCVYVTSNYHLLRAGVFARRAGLRADGIGARTALYYLPTALLREYIGFVWMYRKLLLILAVLAFLAVAALFGFSTFVADISRWAVA